MTPNPTLVPAGQGSEYHYLLKVITNTQSNSYFGAFDPKQLAGRQSPVIREARPRRVRARAQFAYGGRVMGGWVYGVSERPGTSAEHYLSVLARPDIPATNDLARAMQRASLADWTADAASVLVETMKAGDTVIPLTQAPTARHYVLTSAPNSIAAERLDPVRDEQANGGPSHPMRSSANMSNGWLNWMRRRMTKASPSLIGRVTIFGILSGSGFHGLKRM